MAWIALSAKLCCLCLPGSPNLISTPIVLIKRLRTNSLLNSFPKSTSNLCVGGLIRPLLNISLKAYGASAGKKYQIDKKFFFQLTNVLNQITNFTSFLLKNIFLKKISIWYFFPALTPHVHTILSFLFHFQI